MANNCYDCKFFKGYGLSSKEIEGFLRIQESEPLRTDDTFGSTFRSRNDFSTPHGYCNVDPVVVRRHWNMPACRFFVPYDQ